MLWGYYVPLTRRQEFFNLKKDICKRYRLTETQFDLVWFYLVNRDVSRIIAASVLSEKLMMKISEDKLCRINKVIKKYLENNSTEDKVLLTGKDTSIH